MLKVLFVNPEDVYSEKSTRYRPLWPAYLAAYAESKLGTGLVDFRLLNRKLSKELSDFNPDIVAVSTTTEFYGEACEAAQIAKQWGAKLVVGGPHISVLYETLTSDMDVGCIGEGENTFLELVELFLNKGELIPADVRTIPGTVCYDNDQLVFGPERKLIQKLDDIPHPKRSLLGHLNANYIVSSRGCPYSCAFCSPCRMWKRFRAASAEYIVEEIAELGEQGADMISFHDDLFVVNKVRLRRIRDLLMDMDLLGRVKFTCSCRANLTTPELVDILKSMNVVSVTMGLESGNERILRYLKGNVTVEDNRRAVNLFKDAGIHVNAYFIIGSPDETEAEIMDSYDFIKKNRIDFFDVHLLTPYPGTPVWDYAMQKGLVGPEMDWSRLRTDYKNDVNEAVIVSQTLSKPDLWRLYRKFVRLRMFMIIKALPTSPWLSRVPWALYRLVSIRTKLILERLGISN